MSFEQPLRRPFLRRAPLATLAALGLTSLASAAPQVWADQIGTGHGEQVYGIGSDRAGGSYETGSTLGDLGGAQLGNGDAFVTRRDPAGQVLWSRQLGTVEIDEGRSVASDASGGVFVVGNLRGVPGAPYDVQYDVFVARYGPTGDFLWLRELDSGARDVVQSAAPDGAGGVFLAGSTLGNLGAPSAGQEDVWLARVDAAGNTLWLKQFGSDDFESVARVEFDGVGGVLLCGGTLGALGAPLTGPLDVWYARYDGSGNALWLHQFGSISAEGNSYGSGLASDGAGGFFLGGTTYGVLFFDAQAGGDGFLAHCDGQGNQLWLKQFGTGDTDTCSDIAADSQGGVFATGTTFGEFAGANAGVQDVWIARFDGDGNAVHELQFGSSNLDLPLELLAEGDDVVACGNSLGGAALFGDLTNDFNGWAARFEVCDFDAQTSYCTAGVNSTGSASSIGAGGSPYVSSNDFELFANQLPSLETGVFLMADATNDVPFGDGTLCVGGAVQRLGSVSTQDGVATLALDMTDPSSPASLIRAGSTWHFQFWYRDTASTGAGFNLSNGLRATFCP
jgi:hypothetical protein